MLPKFHILFGALFSTFLWLVYPEIDFYVIIVFLSTFLIDIDHYLVYVIRKKSLNLKKAHDYFYSIHKNLKPMLDSGVKVKAPLVFIHTVEFLILVFILALFFPFFLYILSGMLFHSLLDVVDMIIVFGTIYPRSFSILHYFLNKKKNSKKIKFL